MRCFFTGRGLAPAVPAFELRIMAGFVPFVFTEMPPCITGSACNTPESSRSRFTLVLFGSTGGAAPGVGAGVAGATCGCACVIGGGCTEVGVGVGLCVPTPTGAGVNIGGRAEDATGRGVPVRAGTACGTRAEGVPAAADGVGVATCADGPGVPTPGGNTPCACAFASFLSSFCSTRR